MRGRAVPDSRPNHEGVSREWAEQKFGKLALWPSYFDTARSLSLRGLPFSLGSRGIGFDSMHPLSADLFTEQYAPNPARERLLRSLFAWIHGNLAASTIPDSLLSSPLIRPAQLLLWIQFKGKPGLRVGERGIIFESLRQGWGRFMARQGEVIVDAKVGEKISVLTRVQRKLTVTNRRTTPDYDNWKRRKKGGKTAKKRGG